MIMYITTKKHPLHLSFLDFWLQNVLIHPYPNPGQIDMQVIKGQPLSGQQKKEDLSATVLFVFCSNNNTLIDQLSGVKEKRS